MTVCVAVLAAVMIGLWVNLLAMGIASYRGLEEQDLWWP